MRIYVASSWRNQTQPAVVDALRSQGHEVYDWRNPPNVSATSWKQVGNIDSDGLVDAREYRDVMLPSEAARFAFNANFGSMETADACVLVLPCGASAHIEAGWFVGQGRPVCVLLDGPKVTPELMYLICDRIATNLIEVLEWAAAFSEVKS